MGKIILLISALIVFYFVAGSVQTLRENRNRINAQQTAGEYIKNTYGYTEIEFISIVKLKDSGYLLTYMQQEESFVFEIFVSQLNSVGRDTYYNKYACSLVKDALLAELATLGEYNVTFSVEYYGYIVRDVKENAKLTLSDAEFLLDGRHDVYIRITDRSLSESKLARSLLNGVIALQNADVQPYKVCLVIPSSDEPPEQELSMRIDNWRQIDSIEDIYACL
jgi:hypothetical protein